MPITAGVRHQELNPGRLTGLFLKQFRMSKVSQGETMVLLSDMTSRPEYVEAAFAAALGVQLGGGASYEGQVRSAPSLGDPGAEPTGLHLRHATDLLWWISALAGILGAGILAIS